MEHHPRRKLEKWPFWLHLCCAGPWSDGHPKFTLIALALKSSHRGFHLKLENRTPTGLRSGSWAEMRKAGMEDQDGLWLGRSVHPASPIHLSNP